MKKINLSVLIVAAAVAAVGGLWFYGTKDGGREEKKTALRIGVLLYRNDDTFIGTLRNSLEQAAKDYEKETGIRVTLDVRDAKRNQITQNSQAERMIDVDCDVLCVNIVDRSAASGIIDKAMEAGYSTASDHIRSLGFGAGMGLPNMKKCSDEMKIDTKIGVGTTVTLVIKLHA